MSPHSAGELAVACPLPDSILLMADATMRQRATDAWRAASQLRKLMWQWESWFLQLQTTGDADLGLALRMCWAIEACLSGLCSPELGVTMRTFRGACLKDLCSRFPHLSTVDQRSEDWTWDENESKVIIFHRPPWQQDQNFLDQLYDKHQHPDWRSLENELFRYLQLLEVTPSVGLLAASASPPAVENAAQGERDAQTLTNDPLNGKTPQKRGRKSYTDHKADLQIAIAWATDSYPTYADLAKEMHIKEREVRLAVDRHRTRLKRDAQAGCVHRSGQ